MRCLLLLTTAWALAPISTPPKRTEFREGIGGATKEQAVAVGETVACAKQPIGPRDVVIRCYDISSDGKLAPALSLATSKRVHWFPKLTCAVGDRAWAYDGKKRCINQMSRCPTPNRPLQSAAVIHPIHSFICTPVGEIEPTSNSVVARAAGDPVFSFNLGVRAQRPGRARGDGVLWNSSVMASPRAGMRV